MVLAPWVNVAEGDEDPVFSVEPTHFRAMHVIDYASFGQGAQFLEVVAAR